MQTVISYSLFTESDIRFFVSGKHFRLFDKFGSHLLEFNGIMGTYFSVWAPAAKQVSVIGSFNNWDENQHKLNIRWDGSGIWEGFIPNVEEGATYKYKIQSYIPGVVTEKADPYAKSCEHPPSTASKVVKIEHVWKDASWMKSRQKKNSLQSPISVYEMHLSSWKRHENPDRPYAYLELAAELPAYIKKMNFTHVQFMPIMEYPYDPSWGYQIIGYFAPTSRFGSPEDFMVLIETLHNNDIGVLLDWVPSHFPEDAAGLGYFDGSCVYEHPDRRKGYQPDWKSLIFNYGRNEVRSFLISNAIFWLEKYHADGLRVDAVSSMLHLDYSRDEGEWEPNEYGGRENLDVISLLKELNEEINKNFDGVQTIAEESTSYPMVSRPTAHGGLGFGMKWMMGWMNDTLKYFARETIYRPFHQNDLTFSMTYAFSENFMLPLSHDEVVYGKGSLLGRMPGDNWQRFANLRLLFGYMFTHPGTKLLMMGCEFGQENEWNFRTGLDWNLLENKLHSSMQEYVSDLNRFYKENLALSEKQFEPEGFEWLSYDDNKNCVLAYIRKGKNEKESLVVFCNMTPTLLENYEVGVPYSCRISEIFNSDEKKYEGSGVGNEKIIKSKKKENHGKEFSVAVTLPPLAMIAFKYETVKIRKPKEISKAKPLPKKQVAPKAKPISTKKSIPRKIAISKK